MALWALVALVAALAIELSWGAVRRASQPTGDAHWIWKGNVSHWSGPEAFYTWRDFELDAVPAAARLVVLGDREYVLFLNGSRVGGNRYTAGAPLDEYRVESLLSVGKNRLSAHLRSIRGEGAFLLALYLDGSPTPALVTDRSWRIERRWSSKLFRPWQTIGRRLEARVVARPPEGRWGSTAVAVPRPLHDELATSGRGVRARRVLERDSVWRPLTGSSRSGFAPLGEFLLLDWGRVVSGYMTLRFDDAVVPRVDVVPAGAAYFSVHGPDPVAQAPDTYILGTPAQGYWEVVVPRRFRYVLLVGVPGITDARVVLTDSAKLAPIPGGWPPRGVLGRPAPRLGSPVEDEIWRELERLPR